MMNLVHQLPTVNAFKSESGGQQPNDEMWKNWAGIVVQDVIGIARKRFLMVACSSYKGAFLNGLTIG